MIRKAEKSDLDGIFAIYNDAILHTNVVYTYKPYTQYQQQEWYEQKSKSSQPILIFEKDNTVAGFASFEPFRPWPAYKYTVENSIYVHKNFRRCGIAEKLMQALIQLANERELATMVAGIDSGNIKSIKLHEKLGFKYAGMIKKAGYKNNTWLDLLFYQLKLVGPQSPVSN